MASKPTSRPKATPAADVATAPLTAKKPVAKKAVAKPVAAKKAKAKTAAAKPVAAPAPVSAPAAALANTAAAKKAATAAPAAKNAVTKTAAAKVAASETVAAGKTVPASKTVAASKSAATKSAATKPPSAKSPVAKAPLAKTAAASPSPAKAPAAEPAKPVKPAPAAVPAARTESVKPAAPKPAAPKQAAAKPQAARQKASKPAPAKPRAPQPTKRRPASPAAAAVGTAAALDTAQAVLAVLTNAPQPVAEASTAPLPDVVAAAPAARPDRPATPPAAAAPPAPVAPPSGAAHSEILLIAGDQNALAWRPGQTCPADLRKAAQARLDAQQHLAADDDAALPLLLRLASEAGHSVRVDAAVWPHLAAHRDARTRLAVLAHAYPGGPAGAALQHLLRSALPAYQAEGALFAVVAGRALIADERGLGKGVQAIAAARLWQRHFGVRRTLVLCAAGQRSAWQRAWLRFAGTADAEADPQDPAHGMPQRMDGGLHQRQALWSSAAGVRILSPEALASDAAHLAHWAPDLIIIDEPQALGLDAAAWAQLQAPHALVLCGAPLADLPELMDNIVQWLDVQRLGPLAALRELQAASRSGRALTDADIERLTNSLSRLMLQRLRADVADQLPALVHTERLVTLAPGQRTVHDQALATLQRGLASWLHSGYCSDADQWRLASALRLARQACHRADPLDEASALAESTVLALQAQLADWAGTGPLQVAVLCDSQADRTQLAQRLVPSEQLHLVGPDDSLPAGLDAVLVVGVPWRTRRNPAGPRNSVAPGQQWIYLLAQDSLEAGLFNTLASRTDAPRSPADNGGRGYLQGERLVEWLQLLQVAVAAAATTAA